MVSTFKVNSNPNLLTICIPALWLKMCDNENAIAYKAIYSPWFPFFALSTANEFENGKLIIYDKYGHEHELKTDDFNDLLNFIEDPEAYKSSKKYNL